MIVIVTVHRTHEANVVGDGADVRNQIRQLHAAPAVALELERAAHELPAFAAGLQRLELVGLHLAVALEQLRFGVEEVDLAGSSDLHQEDHRSGAQGSGRGAGGDPCAWW